MDTIDHRTGEQWQFRCNGSGVWQWQRRANDGRVLAASSGSFRSLRAAIEDAAHCGFSYTSSAHQQ